VNSLNYPRIIADINSIFSLGTGYFNANGSCSLTSNISLVPVVVINNTDQLISMDRQRALYDPNELVIFFLNKTDSYSSNGTIFEPAFQIYEGLYFGKNMSCSYIVGLGSEDTSILLKNPNYNTSFKALFVNEANDLIVADVTIDRNNETYRDFAYNCLYYYVYDSVYVSNECAAFIWQFYEGDATSIDLYQVIQTSSCNRVHLIRIRTWGGYRASYASHCSLMSSSVQSLDAAIVLFDNHGSFMPDDDFYNVVYNNTVGSSFANCGYNKVVSLFIHFACNNITWLGSRCRRQLQFISVLWIEQLGTRLVSFTHF